MAGQAAEDHMEDQEVEDPTADLTVVEAAGMDLTVEEEAGVVTTAAVDLEWAAVEAWVVDFSGVAVVPLEVEEGTTEAEDIMEEVAIIAEVAIMEAEVTTVEVEV